MAEYFKILLADQVIGIHSLFSEVKTKCTEYLTDDDLQFEVSISPEDISDTREKSDREALLRGQKPYSYSDSYLETLAVYRKIAFGLLPYDILLFHGSVIAVDGVAYLFTAKSGTGKSTHTKFWREVFGSRAVMVNDDKPLLKISEDCVTAYGTPWDGKHHLSTNTAVPLKAICEITRSETNQISRIEKRTIFPLMCQQSFRPPTREGAARHLVLLDRLANTVEFYRLGCNMTPDAARVAYAGMNQSKIDSQEFI